MTITVASRVCVCRWSRCDSWIASATSPPMAHCTSQLRISSLWRAVPITRPLLDRRFGLVVVHGMTAWGASHTDGATVNALCSDVMLLLGGHTWDTWPRPSRSNTATWWSVSCYGWLKAGNLQAGVWQEEVGWRIICAFVFRQRLSNVVMCVSVFFYKPTLMNGFRILITFCYAVFEQDITLSVPTVCEVIWCNKVLVYEATAAGKVNVV